MLSRILASNIRNIVIKLAHECYQLAILAISRIIGYNSLIVETDVSVIITVARECYQLANQSMSSMDANLKVQRLIY